MITLKSKEFASIEVGFQERRRRTLLATLREDGTMRADLPDAAARAQIDAIVEDGKTLGIVDDPDVIRLAQIAFLPEEIRRHPIVGRSLMAVLLDLGQPASDRLDFIFRRVLAGYEARERGT